MKYLLLFLITFNTWAISLSEINALNVDSSLGVLMQRLGKSCSVVDFEQPYTLNNLSCVGGNPTVLELDDELVIYKAELIAIEEARLAELARVNDIKTRLNSLPRKLSMMRTVLGVPNPAAWFRDNISSMDHALMEIKIAEIEALSPTIEAEIIAEQSERTIMSGARGRMKTANCLSLPTQIMKDMCSILKRR